MADQQPSIPPRGIPGKWFALPFGIVLLFAVWLVVSMAFRFQAIMKQLETTREVWPKAANVIRDHLKDSSQSNAATGPVSQSWDDCLKRFSKSSIFDEQSLAAKEAIKMMNANQGAANILDKLRESEILRTVTDSELKRSQLQAGIVGWCTVNGLRLKLPPVFVLD